MLYTLSQYFLLFYFYSIIGYISEVLSIYRLKKQFIWNRGYLLGPYLPVFGFGALITTVFLRVYQNQPITLFVLGMVYCGTLEYMTSLVLEKIFHLRWWDYSKKKYNINGRVCLETSVLFGLGAVIHVKVVCEVFFSILQSLPKYGIITIAIIIFIIMLIDFIISTVEIIRLKKDIKIVGTKDATSEIKKKMKESLQNNYYYYERILRAFPHLRQSNTDVKEIHTELKKIMDKRKKDEK